jgi:hypothetical protein
VCGRHGVQSIFDSTTDSSNLRDQPALDQLFEHAQSRTTGEQIASVGTTVVAKGDRSSDLFADECGANRHTAPERFTERYEMRLQLEG